MNIETGGSCFLIFIEEIKTIKTNDFVLKVLVIQHVRKNLTSNKNSFFKQLETYKSCERVPGGVMIIFQPANGRTDFNASMKR